MIKQLRKRHLQIWYLLAFLIPGGVVIAWISVPAQPFSTLFQREPTQIFLKRIAKKTNERFTANLWCTDNADNCQLEYNNNSPLTVPSHLIYIMKPGAEKIDEHELLGRIESKGSYRFPIPSNLGGKVTGFILYDIVHGNILDTIIFEHDSQ